VTTELIVHYGWLLVVVFDCWLVVETLV